MSVKLLWNNEQQAVDIPEQLTAGLDRLLQIAAEAEKVDEGEVSLTIVDDAAIRELNRDYRGMDKATDVLSFPLDDMTEEEIVYELEEGEVEPELDHLLGDIVISAERALAQSEEYGHSFEREIGFLLVHGFLHLIGYDHEDEQEEQKMFARQEYILSQAGITR